MQGTEVLDDDLVVSGPLPYPATAYAQSISITPSDLWRWGALTWTDMEPGTTRITYRLYDSTGTVLIPDSVLPGNSAGFNTPPVDLSMIPVSAYPGLRVHSELATDPEVEAPTIHEWSVDYERMPPFPNMSFSMRGAKTIGNSPTIY